MKYFLIVALSLGWFTSSASASDCNEALVKETFASSEKSSSDWRFLKYISESEYLSKKQEAGASGKIKGVPVKANWAEFKESIKQAEELLNISLSQAQETNVAWSRLDPSTTTNYQNCLIASNSGMFVWVTKLTDSQVGGQVAYKPTSNTGPITLSWSSAMTKAPTNLGAHQTGSWSMNRPASDTILVVSVSGTDSVSHLPFTISEPPPIVITAKVTPPPPFPEQIAGCASEKNGVCLKCVKEINTIERPFTENNVISRLTCSKMKENGRAAISYKMVIAADGTNLDTDQSIVNFLGASGLEHPSVTGKGKRQNYNVLMNEEIYSKYKGNTVNAAVDLKWCHNDANACQIVSQKIEICADGEACGN